jgi:hypothetical protein
MSPRKRSTPKMLAAATPMIAAGAAPAKASTHPIQRWRRPPSCVADGRASTLPDAAVTKRAVASDLT